MPKQYLRLSNFSDGLNTKFDSRDIQDTELTVANNVQVYKSGQLITSSPKGSVTTRSAGDLESGYGSFLFKADHTIGDANTLTEYLALGDSVNPATVDLITDPFGTPSESAAQINLGSTPDAKFIYYYVDGALRVSDANFGANNRVKWFGHINRSGTIPGGAVDTWLSVNNDLASPTGGNVSTDGAKRYANAGTGFDLDVTVESTDDDGLWEATHYEFAQSFVYEGEQESLLREYSESVPLTTNSYFTNVFAGLVESGDSLSNRIKGGRIYIRKKDSNDLYTLFLDINFERGVRKDIGNEYIAFATDGSNNWANTTGIEIKSPSIDTFESINRFSPDVGHISFGDDNGLGYKDATICNMRTFVCHINYYTSIGASQTKLMPDRILFTPIGKYDTFPPNYFLDIGINDGEDFTAIESFGTRLLAYKESTLYVINVASQNDSEWFLESTHKGLGVDKPSSVIKTEFGVCWARKTGIYAWSPNNGIVELSLKLDKNSSPMTGMTNPTIGYYAPDNQLIIISNCGGASNGLVYDFPTKSFTEIGLGASDDRFTTAAITNIQNNEDNTIFLEGNAVKKYVSSQGTTPFHFETKDFDFGNPGVLKRPKKIIFNFSTGIGVNGVKIRTSVFKNGSTQATVIECDTWGTVHDANPTSVNGATRTIDISSLGTVSSMKIKVDSYDTSGSATTDGNYKINDITVVYRTTRKEPLTGTNPTI
tara:strand:- start:456 stop:2588 length:2133 start_codon:yes stop_codon:yes gene_type:complete